MAPQVTECGIQFWILDLHSRINSGRRIRDADRHMGLRADPCVCPYIFFSVDKSKGLNPVIFSSSFRC